MTGPELVVGTTSGTHSTGTFQAPVVDNADLLGLLGFQSMRDGRAILDMGALRLHLCGSGDYDSSQALPPGTESFQCVLAPAAHMVLPCREYEGGDKEESGRLDTGRGLSLMTRPAPSTEWLSPENRQPAAGAAGSISTSNAASSRTVAPNGAVTESSALPCVRGLNPDAMWVHSVINAIQLYVE